MMLRKLLFGYYCVALFQLIFLTGLFSVHIYAAISTYPAPQADFPASPFYKVTISQGKESRLGFVYLSRARTEGPGAQFVEGRTLSYTGFMATGIVTVEVELLPNEQLNTAEVVIRPTRFSISPTMFTERAVRFELSREGQFVVEFGPEGYRHALIIAYDPWETNAPDLNCKDVKLIQADGKIDPAADLREEHTLYFGSGVHDLGGRLDLPAGIKRVYLAPGAFVYGAFYIGHPDVVIDGRGVLCSGRLQHREAHSIETPPEAKRVIIEGITVTDYAKFAIRTLGRDNVVRWVKCIGGWVYNADGLVGWAGTTLRHNFIHADDDAVKLYDDHVLVEDCVIWQMTNGACLQLGWTSLAVRGVRVRNIDVVRAEWRSTGGANNSVINLRLASGTASGNTQSDFLFENIFVETPVDRLLDLRFTGKKNDMIDGGPHRLQDFCFRNIHARMKAPATSYTGNLFQPYNEQYGYRNIRFENLYINGIHITGNNYREAGYFKIPDEVRGEISFF
ncbi:MAG: hypothetical protein R2824_19870 [Saprospiraceae bacterium]|nr:hypothetical protein [Lewinella sp.]